MVWTFHFELANKYKKLLRNILLVLIYLFKLVYRSLDASNRPSTQTSLDTIKQTAVQTWCLLRNLPFLIGHRIPEGNEYWRLFLLLRDIMDLVFSPMLTRDSSHSLEAVIAEHHSTYLDVSKAGTEQCTVDCFIQVYKIQNRAIQYNHCSGCFG